MKNVSYIAFKDIAHYTRECDIKVKDKHNDVWYVTGKRMNTKENRMLNRKLGLSAINKSKK